MRRPGIEPEERDWKSGMLPLHHQRRVLPTGFEPVTY